MTVRTPPAADGKSATEQLRQVRSALLALHKTLLDYERVRYEKTAGRLESSAAFLQVLIAEPQFAWLRVMSELIVNIDEALEAVEPNEPLARALLRQIQLLFGLGALGEFQRKYLAAREEEPNVLIAHVTLSKAF
jgi:hypothetical protein